MYVDLSYILYLTNTNKLFHVFNERKQKYGKGK